MSTITFAEVLDKTNALNTTPTIKAQDSPMDVQVAQVHTLIKNQHESSDYNYTGRNTYTCSACGAVVQFQHAMSLCPACKASASISRVRPDKVSTVFSTLRDIVVAQSGTAEAYVPVALAA